MPRRLLVLAVMIWSDWKPGWRRYPGGAAAAAAGVVVVVDFVLPAAVVAEGAVLVASVRLQLVGEEIEAKGQFAASS